MDAQTGNNDVIVKDLGFTILANPDSATVDIILIHGLQGHPKNTWLYSPPKEKPSFFSSKPKKPQSQATRLQETFWPLDILSRDFEGARIMTYGYDSRVTRWFHGPAMKLDIDQYGESLLNATEASRRGNPHRPLIFIVHSLGGLILKDALRRARSSREERFEHVYKSTRALLFFGTPHRGVSYTELGITASRIATMAGFDANKKILRSLSFDATHIRVLREDFVEVLRDLAPRLFVFQEGLGYSGFKLLSGKVVDDFSSSLDVGEQKETIGANHVNMCRFAGEGDDGYIKVKAALELAISEVSPVLAQDHDAKKLNLIYPVDPTIFKNDIIGEDNQLLENTGSWIFKGIASAGDGESSRTQSGSAAEAFAKWVNHDLPRVLWIKGEPGKGKTMLAISIVEELQRRNQFNVAHFFCKNSEDKRNTGVNIIESILRQIYSWQPELLSHFDSCAKDLVGMTNPDWKFSTLWNVLDNTIKDSKFQTSYFVIDGLDECDDTSASRFLKRLCRMNFQLEQETNARTKVQWLITSRDEGIISREFGKFQSERALIISLEDNSEEVQKSVEQYISDRVRKLALQEGYDGNLRTTVEDYLRKHANGTFLWVAIVCEELKGQPADVAEEALRRFPSGLTKLYKRILGQVLNNGDRLHALSAERILQAMAVTFEPLTLRELAVAADLPRKIRNRDEGIRSYVGLCRSFLRIQSNLVSIRHQSVKDYLVPKRCESACSREYDFKVLYHPNPARCRCDHHLLSPEDYPAVDRASIVFPIDEAEGHRAIVSRSIDSMTEVLRKDIYNLSQPSCCVAEVEVPDPDPLASIKYACHYWIDHLSAIEGCHNGVGLGDIGKVILFLEKKFLHWLEAMSLTGEIPEAIAMLIDLEYAVSRDEQHDEQRNFLSAIVYDAKRFTLAFRSIIEIYPLQIYNSALLFSPTKSTIRKVFSKEIPAWVQNQRLPSVDENWSPYLHTLEGHIGTVRSIAFSPDGSLLASGADDCTIRLWDPITGAVFHRLRGHLSQVRELAFSPNGVQLASCSESGLVHIWDPTSGTAIHKLGGDAQGFRTLAFSADGNQLASGTIKGTVYVWDPSEGTVQHILKCNWTLSRIRCLAFSPDGSRLATGFDLQFSDDSYLNLWDLSTGKQVHLRHGHVNGVLTLSFSPNGKQLASGSSDGAIQVREPMKGRLLYTLSVNDLVYALTFSADSSQLASMSETKVQLWDPTTRVARHTWQGQFTAYYGYWKDPLKFSPDGSMLAFISGSKLLLYDTPTRTMLHMLEGHGYAIYALAFSPNGSQLASASLDRTVRLWDSTAKALPLQREPNPGIIYEVIFSSDGNRLASLSRDRTIQLWDPATGANLCSIPFDSTHSPEIIAFSPNSQELVSGSMDGSVCIWDPVTGAALNRLSPPNCPDFSGGGVLRKQLALSPDVRRLAVKDKMFGWAQFMQPAIRLCDYTTGARHQILEGKIHDYLVAKFSPDSSRLAAMLYDNTIRLWDTATGAILHTLKSDAMPFQNFAFSPDKSQLATSSKGDTNAMSVQIWDLTTGEFLYKLHGAPEELTFSADGNHLLYSAGYSPGYLINKESELWDLTTREMRHTLDCHRDLHDAAASWDSQDKSQALYLLDSSGECISRNGQKVIILPPDQRASACAIWGKKLALGRVCGGVTILEFE
ncbi:quinon protein alcohol dehydrogenase-like superfamily [Nemania sp. FL0031]|nr:quinon protein alcohol dehydrogenase-like superfamily [Nemania sp. FL0031]